MRCDRRRRNDAGAHGQCPVRASTIPTSLKRTRISKLELGILRTALAGQLERKRVLGWPKRYKLAHAFLWEICSSKGWLKLAQLLDRLGVPLALSRALTWSRDRRSA